jgi:hypothetical protein
MSNPNTEHDFPPTDPNIKAQPCLEQKNKIREAFRRALMPIVAVIWVAFFLLASLLSFVIEAILKPFGWDPGRAPDDLVSFRAQKYAVILVFVLIGCILVGIGVSYLVTPDR